MYEWAIMGGKAVVAFILLLDLIPFMFGLLLDLVVLTPVRVPLHQSPIYFLWQVHRVLKLVFRIYFYRGVCWLFGKKSMMEVREKKRFKRKEENITINSK